MSETNLMQANDDDLPRTLKREKEARARDQLARDILNAPRTTYGIGPASAPASPDASSMVYPAAPSMLPPGDFPQVSVARFEVPFLKMVTFYLKAVVAAIPALILLMLILFAIGQVAQTFLPWLVKTRILISFPG